MRVVLSTFGGRGDVEPFVALAVQLRALGAEVTVCAPPDEDFARRLGGVGVPLVAVGPSAKELMQAVPRPSLPETAARIVADQFAVMPAALDGCDVLVATGALPAAAGGLSVAELLGIPAVSVTFQQLTLPSPHHVPLAYPGRPLPPGETDSRVLWEFDAASIEALFGDALNTSRVAAGMAPVGHVRDFVVTDRPWLATDPVLDPWRPSPDFAFDVVQTGAWTSTDDRPLPEALSRFLDAGEPPVYVGFGSMALHTSPDLARTAIEAIRARGRRVLLARGWANLAAIDDQDDCFVVGEVNHQALFGRVAAAVHHGGAGTTTTAALAGVPQLVVPQIVDQPYWATAVAELGIGAAHDGPTPTYDSLSAALTTVLAPETRARARAVAGTIRTDGTTVAAKMLLDPASGERPPTRA
jgi:vancomycin aglycone glucosyltransferase